MADEKVEASKKPTAPAKTHASLDAFVLDVDLDALEAAEKDLSEAFVAYGAEKARLGKGHPAHEAHNNVAEYASRELGRAHGGIVQALEAIRVFQSRHEDAVKRHAEAEEAKAKKEAEKAKESSK